jgi:transcriptional antiterminator RfaH
MRAILEAAMHWYLVHTKPRQEKYALQNLQQQGYECYLPTLMLEKLRMGNLTTADEPLFPRYLFIRLGLGLSQKSWAPIRSTKGVSRLVTFGLEPAKVGQQLITLLKSREDAARSTPQPLFRPGERVCFNSGAFVGIEGIFHMTDGEQRVMVLIELLSKPVTVRTQVTNLRKIG